MHSRTDRPQRVLPSLIPRTSFCRDIRKQTVQTLSLHLHADACLLIGWTRACLFIFPTPRSFRNIQYIANVIFANIFSCLFQTSLTFQMNISSYHEYSFDRFVCAPFGCIYLLWHFDVPRFTPRAVHQGQLIILREEIADLHRALETTRAEDKSLLSHLRSTSLT